MPGEDSIMVVGRPALQAQKRARSAYILNDVKQIKPQDYYAPIVGEFEQLGFTFLVRYPDAQGVAAVIHHINNGNPDIEKALRGMGPLAETEVVKFMHDPDGRKRDMARVFASGFLINTLNPGVIFFWLGNATVLSLNHTLRERIIIFSVCLLVNMSADVGKVMMAGKLRSKLTLKTLSVINRISGTILIGFGIALLWGVIFYHKLK